MKRPLLLVSLFLALSVAMAASLNLGAPSAPVVQGDQRCFDDVIDVSLTNTMAEFELPEACVGARVRVFVTDGIVEATGELAAASMSNTVSFSPRLASVQSTFLTIDSWAAKTEWSFTGEIPTIECLGDCRIKNLTIDEHAHSIPHTYSVRGYITTDSLNPVEWRLVFNASDESLPFFAKLLVDSGSWLRPLTQVDCSADPRIVTLFSSADWNNTVKAGQEHLFVFTGYESVRDIDAPLFKCP